MSKINKINFPQNQRKVTSCEAQVTVIDVSLHHIILLLTIGHRLFCLFDYSDVDWVLSLVTEVKAEHIQFLYVYFNVTVNF